jgi:hypothetical protein
MSGTRQPGRNPELVVETGTTLTIGPGDAGKVFCNVGAAGNIAYTVGSAATFRPGDQIWVLSAAAGTTTVSFTSGQLIAFNDVAANSVALSTASEIIGGGFLFTCLSASKWHCCPLTEETQTVTVAT